MKVWIVYKQEELDYGYQDIGVEAVFISKDNAQSFIKRQDKDWFYRLEEWITND